MRFLTFELPNPLPFEGVDFEPRQTMRYHSSIDPLALILVARQELGEGEGDKLEQYKVFLLSLCAGLRRNEIDKLEWSAFDFCAAHRPHRHHGVSPSEDRGEYR